MTRAIVHKTKGKLDLRSLTVFGLNAKPNTDTPIGYFGTGLKYAIAVLARNRIPMEIVIDQKKWVIEQDPGSFRDKAITELYICSTTIGGLIKKRIKLPFTIELGKNWELWQAFRELECNTRDEKGSTFITSEIRHQESLDFQPGYTYIAVYSEDYVNEYLNKDTHFLPDGLTTQTTDESMQVFPRKSNYIYYRGIRIYDLKEPTQNTYNFLKQIDLTEDRTAKYSHALMWDIERYIATTDRKDVVERAVTAPAKTYERGLSYDYTSRSELFLDVTAAAGKDATQHTQSILRRDRPPEIPEDGRHWLRVLIDAISQGDYDKTQRVCESNREELLRLLGEAADREDAPDEQLPDGMAEGVQSEAGLVGGATVNWDVIHTPRDLEDTGAGVIRGTELEVQRPSEGNDVNDDIPF